MQEFDHIQDLVKEPVVKKKPKKKTRVKIKEKLKGIGYKGDFMKKTMLVFALILLTKSAFPQVPTQIKQVLPTTPSVVFQWGYNTADETLIDSFVLQRTAFAATSIITSPYSIEQLITQKTARNITYTMPTGLLAGQKAFYVMRARKQGLADSLPSNVVEIDIVPTPPIPMNLNIAQFTEIEFTSTNIDGVKLWVITSLL